MTKEEAWLDYMKSSPNYVHYDWDTIKQSSWWAAFERGWNAGFKAGVSRTGEGWNAEWPGMTDKRMVDWLNKELEVTHD